jgi:hypothetical protein
MIAGRVRNRTALPLRRDCALRMTVEVTLRDLERDPRPPTVFAAPTYLLDGRVISLGNPRREELWARLAQRVQENGI